MKWWLVLGAVVIVAALVVLWLRAGWQEYRQARRMPKAWTVRREPEIGVAYTVGTEIELRPFEWPGAWGSVGAHRASVVNVQPVEIDEAGAAHAVLLTLGVESAPKPRLTLRRPPKQGRTVTASARMEEHL